MLFRIALLDCFLDVIAFSIGSFEAASLTFKIRPRQQSHSATGHKGRFHLPRNSGNSGWDVNGTHVFQAFHWKVPGNKKNFEKVVLFSRWKLSGGNACSIYEFSQGITTSRLFTAKSAPLSEIYVTRA